MKHTIFLYFFIQIVNIDGMIWSCLHLDGVQSLRLQYKQQLI